MNRPYTEPKDIVEAIAARVEWLTADHKAAMIRALASSGKRKGYLKAKAPSRTDDPMGYAAWNGLQPNPYKISLYAAVIPPTKEAGDFLFRLNKLNFPAWLDYDRHALEIMGAW